MTRWSVIKKIIGVDQTIALGETADARSGTTGHGRTTEHRQAPRHHRTTTPSDIGSSNRPTMFHSPGDTDRPTVFHSPGGYRLMAVTIFDSLRRRHLSRGDAGFRGHGTGADGTEDDTQEPAGGDQTADGHQANEPGAGHEPCHPAFPRHDHLDLIIGNDHGHATGDGGRLSPPPMFRHACHVTSLNSLNAPLSQDGPWNQPLNGESR
ncbi:hypothetical protein ACWEN6_30030 [Sphaerisporangium sp. NPDC004334]